LGDRYFVLARNLLDMRPSEYAAFPGTHVDSPQSVNVVSFGVGSPGSLRRPSSANTTSSRAY
jgi:hypothetical protein